MAKKRTVEDIAAAVRERKEKTAPIVGRRDFWDPNATASPVREIDPSTYTPQPAKRPYSPPVADVVEQVKPSAASRSEAILAAAKKMRTEMEPARPASQAVRSKAKMQAARATRRPTAAEVANEWFRTPSPGRATPNRSGSLHTPGSKADMAYTGVKPEAPTPRAAPKARTPRKMGNGPWGIVAGTAAHGIQGLIQTRNKGKKNAN